MQFQISLDRQDIATADITHLEQIILACKKIATEDTTTQKSVSRCVVSSDADEPRKIKRSRKVKKVEDTPTQKNSEKIQDDSPLADTTTKETVQEFVQEEEVIDTPTPTDEDTHENVEKSCVGVSSTDEEPHENVEKERVGVSSIDDELHEKVEKERVGVSVEPTMSRKEIVDMAKQISIDIGNAEPVKALLLEFGVTNFSSLDDDMLGAFQQRLEELKK